MVGGKNMTLLMLCCVILTGRISDWNHYTHFGGVSDILVEGSSVTGATSDGLPSEDVQALAASRDGRLLEPEEDRI